MKILYRSDVYDWHHVRVCQPSSGESSNINLVLAFNLIWKIFVFFLSLCYIPTIFSDSWSSNTSINENWFSGAMWSVFLIIFMLIPYWIALCCCIRLHLWWKYLKLSRQELYIVQYSPSFKSIKCDALIDWWADRFDWLLRWLSPYRHPYQWPQSASSNMELMRRKLKQHGWWVCCSLIGLS